MSTAPRTAGGPGLLLIALVALVALTSCDGRLSKADYVKRGDAICRATNVTSKAIAIPPVSDVAGTSNFLRTSTRLLETQNDKLAALRPPKIDAPRLRDVFTRQRSALELLRNAANQYQLGDTVTAKDTVEQSKNALEEVRQDLQGYGFVDCANQ